MGIGTTDYSKDSGRSVLTLAAQAALAAIADAGLSPKDIDGIVRAEPDTVWHNDLVQSLGIPNVSYWGIAGPGGAAPSAMIGQAIGAIISGQATTVLAYRALNGRSGRRIGKGRLSGSGPFGGDNSYDEFFFPFGLMTPGQMFALITRRHMVEYGTTEEHLAEIAMVCRQYANANPSAQMYERTLDAETYFDARVIADPLRLFDFCLETDGACAVVVTSTERAKDHAKPPAVIRAVSQSAPMGVQGGVVFPTLMRGSITTFPSEQAAKTLYIRAGVGPADIDVVQLYDCFTIAPIIQLEDYGFCKKGEAGDFVASGALRPDGELPMNTSGGLLSEAYIQGMNLVVEGVRQIRGESTSQVASAEVGLVTSGIPEATSALILATE